MGMVSVSFSLVVRRVYRFMFCWNIVPYQFLTSTMSKSILIYRKVCILFVALGCKCCCFGLQMSPLPCCSRSVPFRRERKLVFAPSHCNNWLTTAVSTWDITTWHSRFLKSLAPRQRMLYSNQLLKAAEFFTVRVVCGFHTRVEEQVCPIIGQTCSSTCAVHELQFWRPDPDMEWYSIDKVGCERFSLRKTGTIPLGGAASHVWMLKDYHLLLVVITTRKTVFLGRLMSLWRCGACTTLEHQGENLKAVWGRLVFCQLPISWVGLGG